MTEITTYDEFNGLDNAGKGRFFGNAFGWHNKAPYQLLDWAPPSSYPLYCGDKEVYEWLQCPDGVDAIKQAMIGQGWEWRGGYVQYGVNKPYYFITFRNTSTWAGHQGETESEAFFHAAAKALLGGK